MKHLLVVLALASACTSKEPPRQLLGWLEAWERTRTCVLTEHRRSSDVEHALAIAELTGRQCSFALPPVRLELVTPELGERWERASRRIAELDRPGELASRARMLHVIDADVAMLRAAAGFEPISPPYERRELPALGAAFPILVEGAAIAAHELEHARDGVLYGTARREEFRRRSIAFALSPWSFAAAAYSPSGGGLGRPSWSWAVRGDWRLRADVPEVELEHTWFALDAGPHRGALLLANPITMTVSLDGGSTWRTHTYPFKIRDAWQDPASGAIEVIGQDDRSVIHMRIGPEDLARLAEGRWPRAQVLDDAVRGVYVLVRCHVPGATWVVGGMFGHRVRPDGVQRIDLYTPSMDREYEMACSTNLAFILRHGPDVVERCVAAVCAPVLELGHARRGGLAIDDQERWIYAAAAGDVVGIWREGKNPVFYRLPVPGRVHSLPMFGRVRHLALDTADGLRLVPLPDEALEP